MTDQEFDDLVLSVLGPSNVKISSTELATLFIGGVKAYIQTKVTEGLATAASTAGSEQKSVPGGVDTVAKTNIPLNSGPQIINGYDVPIGGTVLLTSQTNPAENGLYTLGNTGFTRTPGYQTPAELSRLRVSVVYGDDARDVYEQPNTLPSGNPDKSFVLVSNESETIKALLGPTKPEYDEKYVTITTSEPDENGNVIPNNTYDITSIVAGRQIEKVWTWQPNYGDRTINKGSDWDYGVQGQGILRINTDLPEDGRIYFRLLTYGTGDVSTGLRLRTTNDGLLQYRTNNQTDADYQVAGALPVGTTMTIDIPITGYTAGDTYVSQSVNMANKRLVSYSLYDETGNLLDDAQIRFDNTSKTFSFALGYDLPTATLTYRTEPVS